MIGPPVEVKEESTCEFSGGALSVVAEGDCGVCSLGVWLRVTRIELDGSGVALIKLVVSMFDGTNTEDDRGSPGGSLRMALDVTEESGGSLAAGLPKGGTAPEPMVVV